MNYESTTPIRLTKDQEELVLAWYRKVIGENSKEELLDMWISKVPFEEIIQAYFDSITDLLAKDLVDPQ